MLEPFTDPMALLLLGVGGLYLILGDRRDALVMFAAFLPMVGIDYFLNFRMEKTLAALRSLTRPTARVVRDGAERVVPIRDVVPDDLICLEEGDVVPADARLVSGSDVLADESALTGESHPIPKEPGQDEVFAGSTLLLGRGTAVVVATGPRTRYGKIGKLVAGIEAPRTPLQNVLERLVHRLALVALLACVTLAGLELLRGRAWGDAILSAATLALAAVPEEFPLVFTLFLSLGVLRMARHRALIRRWAGVETLGSTSVICCDKTGTLTEGRLRLAATWTPREGEAAPARSELLERAVLASELLPYDPLEKALFEGCGFDAPASHRGLTLAKEYAFERTTFRMSHLWTGPGDGVVLAMKGSLEGVLAACTIDPAERARAEEAHHELACRGMKVLAVASRPLPSLEGTRETDERDLRFDGLVGFADPPRAGVREALARCREAGLRVLMITGDHPDTARAIAEEIGLDVEVTTGEDLARHPDAELPSVLARVSAVARAAPEQKHRIVRALRSAGEVVAMTGDGINDAPALKEADVGVAMGQRGTEVARSAATMVLLDDAFPTIVVAVEEGRRIFGNIQKAFAYLIAFHVPIVLAALLVPAFGWPLLLLPVHAVWLELIVHPISAIAFEAEPPDPDAMKRRPRARSAPLLTLGDAIQAAALGLTLAVAVLAAYAWGLLAGTHDESHARGLAMSVIVLAQIGLVLTTRTSHFGLRRNAFSSNRVLTGTCVAVVASLALVFVVPGLRGLLRVEAPAPLEWIGVAVAAAVSTFWIEAVKAWRVTRN